MVKSEIAKSKYSLEDVRNNLFNFLPSSSLPPAFSPVKLKNERNIVLKVMEQEGWDLDLDNEIFKLNREAEKNTRQKQRQLSSEGIEDEDTGLILPPLPYQDEKLLILQEARESWTIFLKDQMCSIANQMGLPLVKKRKEKPAAPTSNISEILDELTGMKITTKKEAEHAAEIDTESIRSSAGGKPRYTGVFDSKKVQEMCLSICNPNASEMLNNAGWGQIKLEIKTPSIKELQVLFKDLDPEYYQVGIDDVIDEKFATLSLEKAKKSERNLRLVFEVARKGVPTSMRGKIWGKILGLNKDEAERTYFESIAKDIRRREFIIDYIVHNDVKKTVDDENYFVFEDVIDQVMIAFSRDPYVAQNMEHAPTFIYGIDEFGKAEKEEVYPPSGVIPFEGLSLLAAPICYLTNDTIEAFYLWRNMYATQFCKLHTISSKPEGLISLCRLFEDLLQDKDPQLFYHLLHLKIRPLDIAFNWIFYAFSGYLQVDQLLLLWDRILGFSSLYIIPVLAVSIFLFRSKYLLKVTSRQEIFDIFSDFTVVQVIPLLQLFLFN